MTPHTIYNEHNGYDNIETYMKASNQTIKRKIHNQYMCPICGIPLYSKRHYVYHVNVEHKEELPRGVRVKDAKH